MKLQLFLAAILASTVANGQNDFSKVTIAKDSTYGYTSRNPLKMKKGNQQKSIEYSVDFLTNLITEDNQKLEYIQRFTVDDPSYDRSKTRITNRYTGLPMSGKLGLLDKYVFVTSERKDTVILFVDIYNKGELKVPRGLKVRDN